MSYKLGLEDGLRIRGIRIKQKEEKNTDLGFLILILTP